ncbi:UDP-galactopyranose mutase [Pedobacter sp. CG_S7]|uniref:hypothetical protein n=1 Tax=Pedobacter sp. CG_S7 TaxID=3143930 RepID=UPI003396D9F9
MNTKTQYHDLAMQLKSTHFIVRLATYRYYNMDQLVAQALTLFKKMLNKELLVN